MKACLKKEGEFRIYEVDQDSGYYTAFTVAEGAKRAMRHLGSSISGATVAVEGFGKVGRPLAGLLSAAGARIVAISTSRGAIYNPGGLDIKNLGALSDKDGSRAVARYQDAVSPRWSVPLSFRSLQPMAPPWKTVGQLYSFWQCFSVSA